ncbi:hypothetical protein K458DRAFT_415324 [Lentithecium fluviatile CBS 122367]|uniref:Uncharacterized protein n=1 Tax=Lentithecium fluviatile CBS 122367 TaxID=1168545 RepID=A0A6G1J9F5_9PLEO|nr:hypothetical protein K458DRAFT_415324 [Lentithecium fluviatile CBS 122367]
MVEIDWRRKRGPVMYGDAISLMGTHALQSQARMRPGGGDIGGHNSDGTMQKYAECA